MPQHSWRWQAAGPLARAASRHAPRAQPPLDDFISSASSPPAGSASPTMRPRALRAESGRDEQVFGAEWQDLQKVQHYIRNRRALRQRGANNSAPADGLLPSYGQACRASRGPTSSPTCAESTIGHRQINGLAKELALHFCGCAGLRRRSRGLRSRLRRGACAWAGQCRGGRGAQLVQDRVG
jgi:hypothetical protein